MDGTSQKTGTFANACQSEAFLFDDCCIEADSPILDDELYAPAALDQFHLHFVAFAVLAGVPQAFLGDAVDGILEHWFESIEVDAISKGRFRAIGIVAVAYEMLDGGHDTILIEDWRFSLMSRVRRFRLPRDGKLFVRRVDVDVEPVDELSEAAEFAAVEVEDETWQFSQIGFITFFTEGSADDETAFGKNVGELVVDLFEGGIVRGRVEAEHQFLVGVSHAVIDPEEPEDFFDCFFNTIGEFEERQILWLDHAAFEEMLVDEVEEGLPVGAAGGVEKHDGDHVAFARLEQGEYFEAFVERSEAAGQKADSVAFFDEHQLPCEEVLHMDELRVAGNDGVGRLLEGEHDIESHGAFASGSLVSGLHDSSAGPCNNQPSGFRHGSPKVLCLLEAWVLFGSACRAEDGHLAGVPVGAKDLEGVAEFTECTAEDFQVATTRVVFGKAISGIANRFDEVGHIAFAMVGRGVDFEGNLGRIGLIGGVRGRVRLIRCWGMLHFRKANLVSPTKNR